MRRGPSAPWGSKPSTFFPFSSANSRRNDAIMSGRSSLRSRSGGTWMRTDVEPVEKVLAKASLGDLSRSRSRFVAVHDPHVDLEGFLSADSLEFFISCKTLSILICTVWSISPISSRNIVPWCASSNRPRLRATAPVKEPFSWPKSSLSKSVSASAAQMHLDEGLILPGRQVVESVRDELLSYAAFPRYEHGSLGRRDALNDIEHLEHRLALPDYVLERFLPLNFTRELSVLERELAVLEGAPDEERKPIKVEWLREEIVRARTHRLYRALDRAVPGEHDDRYPPASPRSRGGGLPRPRMPGMRRSVMTRSTSAWSTVSRPSLPSAAMSTS